MALFRYSMADGFNRIIGYLEPFLVRFACHGNMACGRGGPGRVLLFYSSDGFQTCIPTRVCISKSVIPMIAAISVGQCQYSSKVWVNISDNHQLQRSGEVVEEETKGDALAAGFPTTENHAYQQRPRTVSVLQIGIATHLHLQVFSNDGIT